MPLKKLDYSLFEKTPDVAAVIEFAKSSEDSFDNDEIDLDECRLAFEKCVSVCGYDILYGGEIWELFREFEMGIFEDLINELGPEEKSKTQSGKSKVIKCFHRQLAVPLMGNATVLAKFSEWLGEYCIESDADIIDPAGLEKKFAASEEARECRMPYEEYLLSVDGSLSEETRIKSWRTYIAFEIQEKAMTRAQRLYERSLQDKDISSSAMYGDYCCFAMDTVKNYALVESIIGRGLESESADIVSCLSNDGELWYTRITAAELAGIDAEGFNKLVATAVTHSFSSADHYIKLYKLACGYHVRIVKKAMLSAQASSISKDTWIQYCSNVRDAFHNLEVFIESYYPAWLEGWCMLYKYTSLIEDTVIAEVGSLEIFENDDADTMTTIVPLSKSADMWVRAVSKFPHSYYVWIEYLQWASRMHGPTTPALCRKLYKKAAYVVSEYSELIVAQWVEFEEQQGATLQDVMAVHRLACTKNQPVAAAAKPEVASASSSTVTSTRPQRDHISSSGANKRSHDHRDENPSDGKKRMGLGYSAKTDLKGEKIVAKSRSASDAGHVTAKRSRVEKETTASSPAAVTASYELVQKESLASSAVTVWAVKVSNLDFRCTEEDVRSHCQGIVGDSGGVTMVVSMVLSKAGGSRGMAVVSGLLEGEREVLTRVGHNSTCGGRAIVVQNISTEEQAALQAKKEPSNQHPTTVYVTNLVPNATNDDLLDAFKSCGQILEAKVTLDKATKLSKGHALVQFAHAQGKQLAMKQSKKLKILGGIVTILPSRFPCIVEKGSTSTGVDKCGPIGAGVDKYGPSTATKPSTEESNTSSSVSSLMRPAHATKVRKSNLSLPPRSLQPRSSVKQKKGNDVPTKDESKSTESALESESTNVVGMSNASFRSFLT